MFNNMISSSVVELDYFSALYSNLRGRNIMRYIFFIVISVFFLTISTPVFSQETTNSEVPVWRMKGNLVITDTCGINCPCLFGLDPHHGHCMFLGGMKINDGSYGDMSLKGVTWGVLGEFTGSGENLKFIYTGYYIDDNASDGQQEALRNILSGAPFSGLGEQLGIKVVDVNVVVPDTATGEYRLTLGDMGDMVVLPVTGNDKSTPQKVQNPVYPFPAKEIIIGSATGKFNDHGKDINLENNSGEISEIELTGGGS